MAERYGNVWMAILRAVLLAPILETIYLVFLLIIIKFVILKSLQDRRPAWKDFINKRSNLIAALICGIIATILHSHSGDWGVHGGLFFIYLSFLYFTLSEKSPYSAMLSLVALHAIWNAVAIVINVIRA